MKGKWTNRLMKYLSVKYIYKCNYIIEQISRNFNMLRPWFIVTIKGVNRRRDL